jgi:biotin carboxylase
MLLGAGPSQLAGIKAAVALGYHVITVDFSPSNIGHRFANETVDCSTCDKERLLDYARKLNIDGIATIASDRAVPAVAFVADKLGKQGPTNAVSSILCNKASFRTFQQENGLLHPRFVFGTIFSEVYQLLHHLGTRAVFKPVDNSGSRGISTARVSSFDECKAAFENAQHYSGSKTVCVEEFVLGKNYGGEAFLKDGKLEMIVVSEKFLKGFAVTGHWIPADFSPQLSSSIAQAILSHCDLVGYQNGALNFDVIVTHGQVHVLEMSPRVGGNGLYELVGYGSFDKYLQAVFGYSLGETFTKGNSINRSCGSYVFGAKEPGTLSNIASKNQITKAIPEILEYSLMADQGSNIEAFEHGGNMLGYCVFSCTSRTNYLEIVDKINQTLDIEIG